MPLRGLCITEKNEEKNKMDNKKVLKVIENISQVLAYSFDGALDKDGNPIKIGLSRETNPLLTRETIDGFRVRISADVLILSYHSEIRLKDVHDSKFENKIESIMDGIIEWISKEYGKLSGEELKVVELDKEAKILVQTASRVSSWIQATKKYTLKDLQGLDKVKSLEENIKEFSAEGKKNKLNYFLNKKK